MISWESRPVTYALAGIGLLRGAVEVFLKPFAIEETEQARHIAAAAITYYTTGESE